MLAFRLFSRRPWLKLPGTPQQPGIRGSLDAGLVAGQKSEGLLVLAVVVVFVVLVGGMDEVPPLPS